MTIVLFQFVEQLFGSNLRQGQFDKQIRINPAYDANQSQPTDCSAEKIQVFAFCSLWRSH